MAKKAHTSNNSWLEFNATAEHPKLPPLQRFDRIFAPTYGSKYNYGLYWFDFKSCNDGSTKLPGTSYDMYLDDMLPIQAYANKPQQPNIERQIELSNPSAWKYTKGMLEWFFATWANLSGNGSNAVTLRTIHELLVKLLDEINEDDKVSKIPNLEASLRSLTWVEYHYTNMLLYIVDTLYDAGIIETETTSVRKVDNCYIYLKESIRSVTALDALIYESLEYHRYDNSYGISTVAELSQKRRIEKLHYAAIAI